METFIFPRTLSREFFLVSLLSRSSYPKKQKFSTAGSWLKKNYTLKILLSRFDLEKSENKNYKLWKKKTKIQHTTVLIATTLFKQTKLHVDKRTAPYNVYLAAVFENVEKVAGAVGESARFDKIFSYSAKGEG